jgi:hypothetical protein
MLMGDPRRTDGPTVDFGGEYCGEKLPVEAGVSGLQCSIANILVKFHAFSISLIFYKI